MFGYHITLKEDLEKIAVEGLLPLNGTRSKRLNDSDERICFSSELVNINTWRRKLFLDKDWDELSVLTFEITDINYFADTKAVQPGVMNKNFYTKQIIPPSDIYVIQVANENDIPQHLSELENWTNAEYLCQIERCLDEYEQRGIFIWQGVQLDKLEVLGTNIRGFEVNVLQMSYAGKGTEREHNLMPIEYFANLKKRCRFLRENFKMDLKIQKELLSEYIKGDVEQERQL